MSIFNSVRNWLFSGLNKEPGIQYPGPVAYPTESASTVTFDSAMQLSAVWACVKLIAETIASLPLTIYKTGESGRVVDTDSELATLFRGKVNSNQTKVEFFETVALNLIVHGNAYCKKVRSGRRLVGLVPIMSAQVQTVLLPDGSVVHEQHTDTGVIVHADESIWHLKLMGNGIVGMSPLAYQRDTLGIAQAAETATTKIYRNGAKPSGVLTIDRVLTSEQRKLIRESFATLTVSTDDRLMVLEGGMKFDAISLSPQDIELLSSRRFQLSEICRWYGVPSVMINDTSSTTVWGSGIEQIVQGFYKLTLRPLLEKIEASMLVNLIGDVSGKYEIEFGFEGLLRADQKSRFDGYRVGIQGGILTPNEARRLEGLPDMEGGDVLYMQGATIPINQAGLQLQQNQSGGAPDNGNSEEINSAI